MNIRAMSGERNYYRTFIPGMLENGINVKGQGVGMAPESRPAARKIQKKE